MKATISLEYIGEVHDARLALLSSIVDQVGDGLGRAVAGNPRPRKPWVAEITGRDPKFGLRREFLPANWQRKRANGAHSRGVELWFIVETGRIYEVKAPASWRSCDRYFCTVTDAGDIRRLSTEEAEQWLNARSELMS